MNALNCKKKKKKLVLPRCGEFSLYCLTNGAKSLYIIDYLSVSPLIANKISETKNARGH